MRSRREPASPGRHDAWSESAGVRRGANRGSARAAPTADEIEGARVDQQPFEDVAMPAQVRAAHPARVIDVRERPLHVLPASPQQPLTARAAHPPAIAVHGPLRVRGRRPLPAAAIGLREVGPDPERPENRAGSDCCDSPYRPTSAVGAGRLGGRQLFVAPTPCRERLVVSPTSAPCRVTATSAPLRDQWRARLCARGACGHPSSS